MSETVAVLKAVRDLLSNPEHWTKQSYARRADGSEIPEGNDPRACCWCLFGAVHKVTGEAEDPPVITRALWQTLTGNADAEAHPRWGLVTGYNDEPTTTHADVLSLLDRTIARLSETP